MDKVENILESFEDLIVNYKHLFKKISDLKIVELKEKAEKDFIEMRKEFGKLIQDPDISNVKDVEERHRKISNENIFTFEKTTSNDKEEIKELNGKIRLLGNELEEMKKKYNELSEISDENLEKLEDHETKYKNALERIETMEPICEISFIEKLTEAFGKYNGYPAVKAYNDFGQQTLRLSCGFDDNFKNLLNHFGLSPIYLINFGEKPRQYQDIRYCILTKTQYKKYTFKSDVKLGKVHGLKGVYFGNYSEMIKEQ